MKTDLEPLPPDCADLLRPERSPPMSPAGRAAMWTRIEASAAALGAVGAVPAAIATASAAAGAQAGTAAATAAGAAAGTTAGTTAGAAAGTAGAAVVGKLGAVLIVGTFAAGVAVGGVVVHYLAAPAPNVVVKVVEVPVTNVPSPPKSPPSAPAPAPSAPVRPPPRARAPVSVGGPPPSVPAPPPAEPLPSSEERQLLETARTALLKQDATEAIAALARHRQSFPDGQLAEERDSLEVQALAQAGRSEEARSAAIRFHAAYPQSVFGAAVDAATRR